MANKLQKLVINRADLVDSPSNPMARVLLYKAKLDSKDKKDMSDSEFAYVSPDGTKHLPIHDASHVRNALARLNQTDIPASAKVSAKKKIDAAAKRLGVKVAKDAQTTNDVLAADEFWDNYYEALDAFRMSVSSIMCDDTLDGKGKAKLLKQSVSEIADNLDSLFDQYPITKSENDEIYEKYEKTVDVFSELGKLVIGEEISADEVSKILEGLEMPAKENQETVETLKAQLVEKDAEIAKAKKDMADKQAELDAEKKKEVKKNDEVVDIWKGVSPEIKLKFEAMEKSTKEASEIAKAAEENAATVRLEKRVNEDLKSISGTSAEKTELLRSVEKMLPADKFEKLYTILKDASVTIAKSVLLTEKGTNQAGTGNTAFEKLQAKANELVASKVAKSNAEGVVMAAKQNPELYKEYLTEGKN